MKHKPDASWNAGSTERRGVRQSLTRAGVQLGYAVTGALTSSLEALEERLAAEAEAESGPPASGGTAQSRMRELLTRDRAALHAPRRGGGRAVSGNPDEPAYGYTGKQSGGTARGRMRELLHKDRAMIATLDDEPFSDLLEQSGTLSLPIVPASAAAPRAATPQAVVSAPQAAVIPAPQAAPIVPALQAPVVAAVAAVAAMHEPLPAVTVMRAPMMIGLAPPAPLPASTVVSPAPIAPEPIGVAAPVIALAVVTPAAVTPAAVTPAAVTPAKKAMPMLLNQAPVGSAAPALAGDGGDSPIRTRSMARLLALQGYRERALSIYDELLIVEPDNTDMRAEADRLRG